MQTNKTTNVILGIIALVLIVTVVLLLTNRTVAPIGKSSDTAQPSTSSSSTATTTPAASTATLPATNPYTNPSFHFTMNLPAAVSTLTADPGVSGMTVFYPTNAGTGSTDFFRELGISSTSCLANIGTSAYVTVTVNGVSFIKTNGSGAFGGMESGSIDESYCAMHDGQSYSFTFTKTYDRVDGSPVPDTSTTDQAFDQEMSGFDFAFTQ